MSTQPIALPLRINGDTIMQYVGTLGQLLYFEECWKEERDSRSSLLSSGMAKRFLKERIKATV